MKASVGAEFKMKDEYDFSKGVRGAYTQSFRELNLVSLDDDVKKAFGDSEAVNRALRSLLRADEKIVPTEQPAKAS